MDLSKLLSWFFREGIPNKNLKLMLSPKAGGMRYLLMRESIGANTEDYKEYHCAAANFIFNKQNGEIISFTNYRKPTQEQGCGTFIVAALDHNTLIETKAKYMFFKIVEQYSEDASKEARLNLDLSVTLYNKKCKVKGLDV